MREIKFRAWDTTCDHMIYSDCTEEDYWWCIGEEGIYIEWYDPCIVRLTPDGPVESEGWVEINKSIIMEYTGIKDKNGKEIYEGDILRTTVIFAWDLYLDNDIEETEVITTVVEYQPPKFTQRRVDDGLLYTFDMEDFEVIGNIYENPEGVKSDTIY